jgi:hypothetical protein
MFADSRGICHLSELEDERTHRISIDLEDGAGIIDLFVTITGTTPLQEATNDGENSNNVALDVIPSRLSDTDIGHYVSLIMLIYSMFVIIRCSRNFSQAYDRSILYLMLVN